MGIGGNEIGDGELGAAVDHVDIARDERVLNARDVADKLGVGFARDQLFPNDVEFFYVEIGRLPAIAEPDQLNNGKVIVVNRDPALVFVVPQNVAALGICDIDGLLVVASAV